MRNLRLSHPGYTLISHLFRQFLTEAEKTTAEAEGLRIRDFYNWAQARREANSFLPFPLFPDHEAVIQTYEVSCDLLRSIEQIFEDPFNTCQQLQTWWPMLCLAGRKPLKHKPVAVSLSAAIRYEDGTVAQVPYALGTQGEPYSDGMILTTLRAQLQIVTELLLRTGSDRLYAQAVAAPEVTPVPVPVPVQPSLSC